MGYSMTWVAVRGKLPEQVLAELDASPTGRRAAFGELRLGCCTLPGGWQLVAALGAGHRWVAPESLAALSSGAEVVACVVEEHTMFSSAEGWQAGERRWRVLHDAQQAADHLVAEGELPSAYAGIAAEQRQLQASSSARGVDELFEIPLKLAQALVGFKHDEGGPGADGVWKELSDGPLPPAAIPAEKKPWWKRW
jgi:hypothetical protein